MVSPYYPAIPFLGIHPNEPKTYSIFICDCPKQEVTKMSLNRGVGKLWLVI